MIVGKEVGHVSKSNFVDEKVHGGKEDRCNQIGHPGEVQNETITDFVHQGLVENEQIFCDQNEKYTNKVEVGHDEKDYHDCQCSLD